MEGMAMQTLIFPSMEYLHECFNYEPATGKLFWKARPESHFANPHTCLAMNGRFAGKEAASINSTYRQVSLDLQIYLQHRIIWKWMTGEQPPPFIDHKDGDKLNNRWANLRSATKSEQNWNVGKNIKNTSGYKGVSRAHGKWRANIRIGNVQKHLGLFPTAEEAAVAYKLAARSLHGAFYRDT
jgi:hypothetical protein